MYILQKVENPAEKLIRLMVNGNNQQVGSWKCVLN